MKLKKVNWRMPAGKPETTTQRYTIVLPRNVLMDISTSIAAEVKVII